MSGRPLVFSRPSTRVRKQLRYEVGKCLFLPELGGYLHWNKAFPNSPERTRILIDVGFDMRAYELPRIGVIEASAPTSDATLNAFKRALTEDQRTVESTRHVGLERESLHSA